MTEFSVTTDGDFKYLETGGKGEVLLLLHGLFGALSNFKGIINHFSKTRNVVIPILPMFEMPMRKVSVNGLVEHVSRFVDRKGYTSVDALGNSLGGHIALLFALSNPDKVRSIILTGSSGLFENSLGSTFPRRGDYEFVRKKTQAVFYDPDVASDELIDEVYDIVNDRNKAIRLVWMAKSALRQNLANKLHQIEAPTLLIWGKDDNVTPPFVAEKFDELIENTQLVLFDKCGHAPMMEHPEKFNAVLTDFLENGVVDLTSFQAQSEINKP